MQLKLCLCSERGWLYFKCDGIYTTVSYSDSDTESYTSDSSYTHSWSLFVDDNELSDMTNVTDCNTDTDEKVKFH